MSGQPVLEVTDLRVTYRQRHREAVTVDGLSFSVQRGEVLGIVGESGSGKSMTSMAMMGLLPAGARVTGSIKLDGTELVGLPDRRLREIRGNDMAMVFQDALAALNPVMTVGDQLGEAMRVHGSSLSRAGLRRRSAELLEVVGIPSPERRVEQYPHEFSGGMRQRVMIAMAICNEPMLLIADEPTTALDVTVQAQVLETLRDVQARTGTTLLLITHDLGVVAGIADRVLVMYAGNQVEEGPVDSLFYETSHPYTSGLLASIPNLRRRSREERLFHIGGQPPPSDALPPGCRFAPRCPHVEPGRCDVAVPVPELVQPQHVAACHRVHELKGLAR